LPPLDDAGAGAAGYGWASYGGDRSALTEREQDVLRPVGAGRHLEPRLAERLVVSENTVKYHLRNILDKLHLQNRTQVVAYAMRHGLTDGK
jgi:DNA-binding NarL/FixJ family response regulator